MILSQLKCPFEWYLFSLNSFLLFILCTYYCVYMYGVLKEAPTSHSTCVEVREQIFGVSSFLVPWGIGTELRSSGLDYMCLLPSELLPCQSLTKFFNSEYEDRLEYGPVFINSFFH